MRNFLEQIRPSAERRARATRAHFDALKRQCEDLPPPPRLELSNEGFDLIAEVKRRAPSAGTFDDATESAAERAAAYVDAGAAAVSVLTEPEHFAGGIADLTAVAARIERPVLAKDFLLEPAQLFEARVAGASGALLIVRMLDDRSLRAMIDAAAEAGLFLLIESFDERDLERAAIAVAHCQARGVVALAGLNARDLDSLEICLERFEELRGRMPYGAPPVAESGITNPARAAAVAELGYRMALVGSALMRSATPLELAAAMLDAGRAAAPGRPASSAKGVSCGCA